MAHPGCNNNAYCQDNPTSWVDWTPLVDPESEASRMLAFTRRTLALREDSPALHQAEFFEGRAPSGGDGVADLVWFGPDGTAMNGDDWFDGARRTMAMWLDGRDVRGHSATGAPLSDDSWLLVLHAGPDPTELVLPGAPYGEAYTPVLDTDTDTGQPADPSPLSPAVEYTVPCRTVWLLRAHRPDRPTA